MIDFTANMSLVGTDNVDSYDVYINDDYYGNNVSLIQITTNDVLRIEVTKIDNTQESKITFNSKLV
jgi:fibronectin type 3 domain-containing protein